MSNYGTSERNSNCVLSGVATARYTLCLVLTKQTVSGGSNKLLPRLSFSKSPNTLFIVCTTV